ncbi:TIGR04295 family B12-binding domain-containing radical SAM protein [Rhodopila sp.]|uniref:TIGR04295 family B12-binding domain-containing radical SAM protein n=1 Tax=Rhodopila sp. TaxID=2480087 RepID=UPI003D0B58BE
MKVALINPAWRFDHSIYFGCQEPHLPLELGYAKTLLENNGHDVLLLDGMLDALDAAALAVSVQAFQPDMTVVTTAPTYLFWRCAPPELRVPRDMVRRLAALDTLTVAVGPHGSSTPEATLRKLDVDVVLRGECEQAIVALADAGSPRAVAGAAWRAADGEIQVNGPPVAARFTDAPPLVWPDAWVQRHRHHHHRFDTSSDVPGAEVEASRGCPYACSFCAKIDFRDSYRRRDLPLLLAEIDGLISQGVGYLYFIDEIFLPQRPLLQALRERNIQFGVQTRIDLWKPDMIALLGSAGCVSIEAGIESLTPEGRAALDKNCRMTTEELTERLVLARQAIPFVQANLIRSPGDDMDMIAAWRDQLRARGVWANDPVPMYPYPSSPDYRRLWGNPDDQAWERAHAHYLGNFEVFSDIQGSGPLPLAVLEDMVC